MSETASDPLEVARSTSQTLVGTSGGNKFHRAGADRRQRGKGGVFDTSRVEVERRA